MEGQNEREIPIRDLVDELARLLVIDDDDSGFFVHYCLGPGVVEISRTSPFRDRCSIRSTEDEPAAQFRIPDVRNQQAPIFPVIVAANDLAAARMSDYVKEGGDVLDFTIDVRNRTLRLFTFELRKFLVGPAPQVRPDVHQLDVITHPPRRDQPISNLLCVHSRAERQDGLRQRPPEVLKAPNPSEGRGRHSAHRFGDPPQDVVDVHFIGPELVDGLILDLTVVVDVMHSSNHETH